MTACCTSNCKEIHGSNENDHGMFRLLLPITSWGCNTAAARHHERICIDMDVIVVQAALPHIFDQQVTRKGLILDIGVCIMEEK